MLMNIVSEPLTTGMQESIFILSQRKGYICPIEKK